ncbi:MAG: hypothetical protein Q7W16_07945 [Coriobacteriia bacterium]|nr:hypothetical protein [Coriobacteriia bacterium]
MTGEDDKRLRAELEKRLRRGGDLSATEALPSSAIGRWMNGAGMSKGALPGYPLRQVVADLMGWWKDADPDLRAYVLGSVADGEPPTWWPAYERWLGESLRPEVDPLTDPVNFRGADPGPWRAVEKLERLVGLTRDEALAYVWDRETLHMSPLRAVSVTHPRGAQITITVLSPFVDTQAVADLYERVSQRILGESAAPPNIKPESVRFYLAYDDLVKTFPRDKQARLEALPEDLRGERSANSAAAYYGKLKRALLEAFESSDHPRGGGEKG